MDDFRLRVFISAARHLNFTECAAEMCISQPAVSKHIGELESQYRVQLFERRGSRLTLTDAGRTMLDCARRIEAEYERLRQTMSLRRGVLEATLRIGASTTIAQYVLPRIVARFVSRYPDVHVSMIADNSRGIEQALEERRIDLGLVENGSRRQGLRYRTFMRDELVLVVSAASPLAAEDRLSPDRLRTIPLVLREDGSGTLEIISDRLVRAGLSVADLKTVAQIGTTEGIKSYIAESDAAAIVSIAAVGDMLRQGRLKVIELPDIRMERHFAFVRRQGDDDPAVERFVRFAEDNRLLCR